MMSLIMYCGGCFDATITASSQAKPEGEQLKRGGSGGGSTENVWGRVKKDTPI